MQGITLGNISPKKGLISGLALGCDSAAHKSALSANGLTTAFLAQGLDKIYPSENKSLAKSIIEKGGLLISEYPIGEKISTGKLIERDRLQAALAQATIVIQSEWLSMILKI
jgi:DNA processing protein